MASLASRFPQRTSLIRSFFATRGQNWSVSSRVYLNKAVYAFIRSTQRMPAQGWVHSRWHWYRFPFSMRNSVLWSPFLNVWFSPEDESALECMLRLPDYEPISWVNPRQDDVFLDVGAYVGPYSILAANAVGPRGRVIAMEPDDVNRRQLHRNLALNHLTNCTVIPCAAWSRSGRIGWHKGDQPVWHGVAEHNSSDTVEAVTVDEIVSQHAPDRVDWIKMDIEGGEIEALKGAKHTLMKFRPVLFIEVHETMATLRTLLDSFNYTIERESFDQPPDRHGWVLARSR